MDGDIRYQSGFGNHFATEAVAGALPVGQNSPQSAPFGLYAEQLSGTAFTAPRAENLRSWCYRIRPSVLHGAFNLYQSGGWRAFPLNEAEATPNQLRWDPLPLPEKPTDFLQGVTTLAGNGNVTDRRGSAVHLYAFNQGMRTRYFYNADGEMLFVPEKGKLELHTELGRLVLAPGEIGVIPRGVKFQAHPEATGSRGYISENYGSPFRLPQLGPIGANGLANPRDFLTPVASYEEKVGAFELVAKFQGKLWHAQTSHSPLDVVAWHGNYAPYKYDLALFQAVNSVTFDHSDPSIFTVLTSPSEIPGTANVDFVIFPPRWMVAEHTFRPPYFHRNTMSEFMGLIKGTYDAKAKGFLPGGGSLHNCMSGHGPDAETYARASQAELKPAYLGDTLAFMFESFHVFRPTAFAVEQGLLQSDYLDCWKDLKSHFNPTKEQHA